MTNLPGIRVLLRLLVLTCIVPAALVTMVLIYNGYERDVNQIKAGAIETARSLSSTIDQHVYGIEIAVTTLADSHYLINGLIPAFDKKARSLEIFGDRTEFVLVNPKGVEIVNTTKPIGSPLGTIDDSNSDFDLGSNPQMLPGLLYGGNPMAPIVYVSVPARVSGQSGYKLITPASMDRLRAILLGQNLPGTWTAAVLDPAGRVLVHSADRSSQASEEEKIPLISGFATEKENASEGMSSTGVPTISAYSRSAKTGWTVLIGMPQSELRSNLAHSLVHWLLATFALLALSLGVAWVIAGKIIRSIQALEAQASTLGTTKPQPTASMFEFREALVLSDSFQCAGDRLSQANAEMRQRNEDLMQYSAVASHDLRSPLTTLSGFLAVLHKKLAPTVDEKSLALIERCQSSVRHMDQLTFDLLSYAKLNGMTMATREIEFDAVVKRARASLTGAITEKGAEIFQADLPRVVGNEGQLVRLMQNLVENAMKYCNADWPTIRISAQRGLNGWVFSVSDNGIGIAQIDQGKIFEVFKRLHSTQAYPGTGIGLAVCQRIVELHGGRLWVTSAKGLGSIFSFSIPDSEPTQA